MKEQIVGAIVGAIITGLFSVLIFHLGNFSTQESIVESLSVRFDSVDSEMTYEEALESIYQENEQLKKEISSYISDLTEANKQMSELQSQTSQELEDIRQQYNDEIQNKYDVDFQNISLIINGIDTKYNDKVAIINNEKYYSMGFIQYLVDNEKISDNNKKLFIGDIQSEEQMPVSLFDFGEPFTAGKLIRTTDDKDFFNEIEDGQPEFKVIVGTLKYDDIRNKTEYYIAGKYTKFSFETAYSINANQSHDYEIIILGDNKQLKCVSVDRKSHLQKIEVDISGVNYLQIIGKSTGMGGDSFYSLMLEPYLYP